MIRSSLWNRWKRKLIEQVEDARDLKTLKVMSKRPLKFRKLDDF